MEYIVKSISNYEEYNNSWDSSSSSSEVTALVFQPDPTGLATLCENVDELNILMDMLGRPDLQDIIKMFGRQICLEEMYLVSQNGCPSSADVEEYIFSKKYSSWAEKKYHQAYARVTHEHREVLKQYIVDNGDGYKAMLAIAEEKFLQPVSREFYDAMLAKKDKTVRSHPVAHGVSEEELVQFIQLYTIEHIFMLYGSYASEEAEAEKSRWHAEWYANKAQYVEDEDMSYYVQERDITIAPFQMPSNGVLVLSQTDSSSYYCD